MIRQYIFLFLCKFILSAEILKNPGFENADFNGNWLGYGFKMESVTTDVHGGSRAVKVSGRTETYQGPTQYITLQPGSRYTFKSYVKQLNDHPGTLFQTYKMMIAFTWKDNGKNTYFNIAWRPLVDSKTGWVSVNGDFNVPQRQFTKASLYLQGPDTDIAYLFDDVSLQTVSEDTNWKKEADARINNIRKSNLNVKVTMDSSLNTGDIEVKLDHKRHLFAFGSMMKSDYVTKPEFKGYQDLAFSWFNWGTIGSFKWLFNRGTKNKPDYKYAVDAMKTLKSHGIKVRGHNICWGVPTHSPGWLERLDGPALKQALQERINYITGITKGQLEHWDVNNELLHGQLYEEITGDPHYSEQLWSLVHKADPVPKLFLNDYNVVAVGAATDAYVEQGKEFKKANVHLYGLGIQSHFPDNTAPDPTLMKSRLDKLATTGLPLWVTELDVMVGDEHTRAEWYDMALRTYFSHPAVEGVILWGFWDHETTSPLNALVSGSNYYVNAAGQRFKNLTQQEWSTHVSHKLTSGSEFKVRGFQGDYDVVVYDKGQPVYYQEYHLGKSDQTLNIHIGAHPQHVTLPTTAAPYVQVTHPNQVSHNNEHLIGREATTATNKDVQCITRWSGFSETGDNKMVYVKCHNDEVLTGCSSAHKDRTSFRDGETIERHDGRMACKAVDGWKSTEGVQAIARCCKTKDLKCNYRGAGPTAATIDAMVVTNCQQQEVALGCSAWNWNEEMSGAYPSLHNRGCFARNDGTTVGTSSYAACCTAPGMTCVTKVSSASGPHKGNSATAHCDTGYTMTSCNVRSDYGKSSGAWLGGVGRDECIAVNGAEKAPGESGVQSVAVCCKREVNGAAVVG